MGNKLIKSIAVFCALMVTMSFTLSAGADEEEDENQGWTYTEQNEEEQNMQPDEEQASEEDTDAEESDGEEITEDSGDSEETEETTGEENEDSEDADDASNDDEEVSEQFTEEELNSVEVSDDFNVEENNEQRSQLREEQKELRDQLKLTDKEIKAKKAASQSLQKQISSLSQSIKKSNQRLEELNSSILDRQKKIDAKLEEIKDVLDLLRTRLREIHTAGDVSSLEIILGAKSFSDFIDKSEMIKSISDHDHALIRSIQGQMDVIAEDQKQLRADKSDVEKEKLELEENKKKINELFEENKRLIEELTTKQEKLESEKKENEEKQAELRKALAAYRKRQAERQKAEIVTVPESDGQYVWPCPGFTYLTALFDEERYYGIHGAIDIAYAGIYGAKVVACADGEVIASYNDCPHDYGKMSSCGCSGGFGNYVMLDHGNGKTSIYAHMCEIVVSTGDTVVAGQLIGYVGSTGYSTGPHLHFETRFDGESYDPLTEY